MTKISLSGCGSGSSAAPPRHTGSGPSSSLGWAGRSNNMGTAQHDGAGRRGGDLKAITFRQAGTE